MVKDWFGGADIVLWGRGKKQDKSRYFKRETECNLEPQGKARTEEIKMGVDVKHVSKTDGRVEQGIESVVNGIITAAGYIYEKGQNIQEILVAPYAIATLSQITNYMVKVWGIIDESNTEVYDPEKIVQARLPEARSAFSPNAFGKSAAVAEDKYRKDLNDIVERPLESRKKIYDDIKKVYDEAALRGIGISEAMQILSDSIGALNVNANMKTTFKPADLYKTLEDLTQVAKSIPKPDLKLLQPLEECLKLNVFLKTMQDSVTYQLSAKTASAVMLTQYNIH